jgi:hypothetical protein
MRDGGETVRRWETLTYSTMSYGFAASGLMLGAGALATGRPLVGACGAVGGVTMGLLERYRANVAERRVAQLRSRLRDQRAEAEQVASSLRRQVRELQSDLWKRDLADATGSIPVVAADAAPGLPLADPLVAPQVPELEPLGPPTGPIAPVIDLRSRETPAEQPAEKPGDAEHDGPEQEGRSSVAAG